MTEEKRGSHEYISINPVEELIKAIGIVHGREQAYVWRRVWETVLEKQARDEQAERIRRFCEQQ